MTASAADFEGDVDRLYQLPLNEFTSARDELTKRLRAAGENERAQEVKKLRKPTAAVWLVNQLARERPLDLQRLLKAGESLTKSQAQAAAGDSSQFSEARRDEHRALEQLAMATREVAERAGVGMPAVGRAIETLRTASLTAEGRDLLRRGRITEELEPPGFEALTGLEVAPAKKKAPRSADRAEKQEALKRARERVRELRAEERELTKVATTAGREAERAEAEAEAARSRAAEAREKAKALADQREAAEADLERLG
jgi:hypothetical protein